MRVLFILFIVVPVLEMWLLIEVGSVIGALPTIALVLLTAVVGVSLLRREGLSTWVRGNRKLEQGELPAEEMIEGLMLAVSGALLLTPGFVTDVVGFLGLIPITRKKLARALLAKGAIQGFVYSESQFRRQHGARDETIIEGECTKPEQKNLKR